MSIHHSTMPEFRNASPACARRRQASAKKNAIFDQVIAKYDANADGELDFGECKKLLADMLGGAQPADEEARDSPSARDDARPPPKRRGARASLSRWRHAVPSRHRARASRSPS